MNLVLLFINSSFIIFRYSRKNQWSKVTFWMEKSKEHVPEKLISYLAVHGFAKILECELMDLSRKYSKTFSYRGTEQATYMLMIVTKVRICFSLQYTANTGIRSSHESVFIMRVFSLHTLCIARISGIWFKFCILVSYHSQNLGHVIHDFSECW